MFSMSPYFWSKRNFRSSLLHLIGFREEMWELHTVEEPPFRNLVLVLFFLQTVVEQVSAFSFWRVLVKVWPSVALLNTGQSSCTWSTVGRCCLSKSSIWIALYIKCSNRTVLRHRKISVYEHQVCKIWESSSRNSWWFCITSNTNLKELFWIWAWFWFSLFFF